MSPAITAAIDAYGLAERAYGEVIGDGAVRTDPARHDRHQAVVVAREQLVAAITASAGPAPAEIESSEVWREGSCVVLGVARPLRSLPARTYDCRHKGLAELVVRRLAALTHAERLAAFDALEQGQVAP